MKKVGFIGAYDKTELILYTAKVLAMSGKKVLVIDDTITQKSKYIVPTINPVRTYITEFEEIDVAVGFETIENIRQYLGLQENEKLEYDIVIVDTDKTEGIENFNLQGSETLYYVTSFDVYSLKRGIEVLGAFKIPVHMKKIFYSKEMLKEEEDYFEYLALGLRVIWYEEKILFMLENEDKDALIENQRIAKIKFKNLSNEFKKNICYIVNDIDPSIGEKQIKNIIKNL